MSDVTVVPTFAPMMTPTAWVRESSPALTKPTTMTVVAEDDWMTAVITSPASMANSRLCVTISSSRLSRLPGGLFEAVAHGFMP